MEDQTTTNTEVSDGKPEEELTFSAVTRKRPRNVRKKTTSVVDDNNEDETDISEAVSAAKRSKTHDITSNTGLKVTTKGAAPRTDAAEVVNFAFASSGAQTLASRDETVTSEVETETERSRDAVAQYQKEQELQEKLKDSKDSGTYMGQAAYRQYVKKDRVAGPIRSTTSIRVTARFDYQPDICKDYKETGYCGYGDNCKFLHDRGDYKTGWQIDKEFEEQERKRRLGLLKEESDDQWEIKEEEELPFACFICRQPFNQPVVTRCGHYFCEDCAIAHHKKDIRCFICKEPTLGIFNTATKILKRQAKIAKQKEQADEEEEEPEVKPDKSRNSSLDELGLETGEDAPTIVV